MKRPISVIIISKDPRTLREIHNRFDALTNFPRLRLIVILVKAFFMGHF